MRIALLHSADALEPPVDPVLDQLQSALATLGQDVTRLSADADVTPVTTALKKLEPELVFNLAESFAGRSALESNVAALLNLLDLRYTGSSPAGLLLAGEKTLTKKVVTCHGIHSAKIATMYRGQSGCAGDIIVTLMVYAHE